MVDAINRKTTGAHIDAGLVERYEHETDRRNRVLKRLVNVLKIKCERGLLIRGNLKSSDIITKETI